MLCSLMFCCIFDVIQQQTVWLFIKDLFVGLGLMVLLGPPVIAAIIIIVQVCWPSTKIFGFLFLLLFPHNNEHLLFPEIGPVSGDLSLGFYSPTFSDADGDLSCPHSSTFQQVYTSMSE